MRACVLSLAGQRPTAGELDLFRRADPFGFILFARNVANPVQLRRLVADLRAAVGRADAPVLIDQEGGRVQRLRPPHWRTAPAAGRIGRLYRRDPAAGCEAARLSARLIAHDLAGVGINVDCAPCLDVPQPGSHGVIGDRAFGEDPEAVATLGRAYADGLLAGGVLPVMKHMPGHGRAGADSHAALPHVAAGRAELAAVDLVPFRRLSHLPCGMTAHVLFDGVDPERAASVSPVVIGEVIRGAIGFDGLLFSDDLGMNALTGSPGERAAAVIAAGTDVATHCSGVFEETVEVVDAVPALTGGALGRAERALAALRRPEPFDFHAAAARLDALLAGT